MHILLESTTEKTIHCHSSCELWWRHVLCDAMCHCKSCYCCYCCQHICHCNWCFM